MTSLATLYEQRLAAGALKPDEDQRRALEGLARLAPSKKPPPKSGFYLWGGVGRGKTMVMDLFFGAAPFEKKRRVHFHAFMLEVHDCLHARRNSRRKGEDIGDALLACAEDVAKKARLLCFDEFHVKDVADAMILGRLFTALFAKGVTVVMTSNIPPDSLYEDGLQRDRFLPFIALLKEKLEIVHFRGETDYRLGRLRGARTYYWPHDGDARAEMEKIFSAIAEGAPEGPVDITVKGRFIHVPRAAREIAWFSFHELCETAKSAVDYLELSGIFRAFIVEDVPRLDDTRHNAVLRFITLVDTLYDRRARLVVSAAAPPEKLYTGEMHAAAFQRTVSRLLEMQSEGYGD